MGEFRGEEGAVQRLMHFVLSFFQNESYKNEIKLNILTFVGLPHVFSSLSVTP